MVTSPSWSHTPFYVMDIFTLPAETHYLRDNTVRLVPLTGWCHSSSWPPFQSSVYYIWRWWCLVVHSKAGLRMKDSLCQSALSGGTGWGFWRHQGILKGGNRVSFWLCVMGSGHIDHHVWRWVIVPSNLAPSFGEICAHYGYRVIYCAIIQMYVWFMSTWEMQLTLNKTVWRVNYEKIWRYNNSPPYMMANWLP